VVGAQGTATVYQHIYFPTNATGNTLGPIPTNLVTDDDLAEWWDLRQAEITNGYYTKSQTDALVAPLAPTNSPRLLNPSVIGWLALPQSQPTNLVLRIACSNGHIIVEEVYP
jgi:hypothetical protein